MPKHKKSCFFFEQEEFEEILERGGFVAEFDLEGILFSKKEGGCCSSSDVYDFLSEHFDVDVTSVHIDDCEYLGIWVVYKENDCVYTKIDIIDNELPAEEKILETFIVKNANKKDLQELKRMIETRFDYNLNDNLTDEEIEKAEDFNDSIWTHINDFAERHFEILEVEGYEINY
jgi:hypothetical protein